MCVGVGVFVCTDLGVCVCGGVWGVRACVRVGWVGCVWWGVWGACARTGVSTLMVYVDLL